FESRTSLSVRPRSLSRRIDFETIVCRTRIHSSTQQVRRLPTIGLTAVKSRLGDRRACDRCPPYSGVLHADLGSMHSVDRLLLYSVSLVRSEQIGSRAGGRRAQRGGSAMTFLLRAAQTPAAAGPSRRREHPALALERATLAILSEGPSHGYAILAKLEKRIGGVCGISYGQVYRVLAGLERRGLIVGRAVQVARRPTRRVYDLSEAGRDDVQRWLVEAPARTMFFGTDF